DPAPRGVGLDAVVALGHGRHREARRWGGHLLARVPDAVLGHLEAEPLEDATRGVAGELGTVDAGAQLERLLDRPLPTPDGDPVRADRLRAAAGEDGAHLLGVEVVGASLDREAHRSGLAGSRRRVVHRSFHGSPAPVRRTARVSSLAAAWPG